VNDSQAGIAPAVKQTQIDAADSSAPAAQDSVHSSPPNSAGIALDYAPPEADGSDLLPEPSVSPTVGYNGAEPGNTPGWRDVIANNAAGDRRANRMRLKALLEMDDGPPRVVSLLDTPVGGVARDHLPLMLCKYAVDHVEGMLLVEQQA
jgi:hypothetical protein